MNGDDPRPIAAIFRSPLFNASETFVIGHAAGLKRYRPLLVGLKDKGNAPPQLRDRLELAGSVESMLLRIVGRAPRLAERLRSAGTQLIHAHFATDGLLALPLAKALQIPLVTTLHGYDVSRSRGRMLVSGRLSWMNHAVRGGRLIRSGDIFLAVSEAVRQRALALGYPPERTRTHYLGIDLAPFAAAPDPQPGLILHVGRLTEKKGTAVLIDAFRKVRHERPDARLAIVGDGPERRTLERRSAGLEGAVQFLGALPRAAVAEWMRRAWLLAAPSLTAADGDSEGLPTVIVEAAAAGLPVVATRHSGIPEAVIADETGLLVGEGEVGALAQAMRTMLGSAELRTGMGIAARRLAHARFDAARRNAALERIYDGLLGQIRP